MSEETAAENEVAFYKRWQFWVVLVVILMICVGLESSNKIFTTSLIEEKVASADDNQAATSAIFASNHPKLYDNGNEASDFAKKHENVITSSNYRSYSDETELSLNIYGPQYPPKDEIVHGITIYPRNDSLNLDDAMNLARDYLPMDIVKKWYKQEWSKIYYDYYDGSNLYAQLYIPTDAGKKWIEENDSDYNYVLILVEMKDGLTKNITLRTTNSVPNTGRGANALKSEKWNYNII